MPLQSQLFKGDAKLEAAAVSDAAHIVTGATGPHVGKIQLALIELDGAGIAQDSIYGPATASAVLAYKKKRNIINRSYQSQADNIVGKMTIAALDREMFARENDPGAAGSELCCNGDPLNLAVTFDVTRRFTEFSASLDNAPSRLANAAGGVRIGHFQTGFMPASPGVRTIDFTASFLSHFNRLSPAQIATATSVFGTSINFGLVFLSDFFGVSGRAFTIEALGFCVMNCGSFTPSNA